MCTYACMYINMYMYVCMYVCMNVCMCVCMDMCVCIYIRRLDISEHRPYRARVACANAPSYKTLSLETAFTIHRNEKKARYNPHVDHKRGSFTPIVATCEGIFDHEAETYIKRLASPLSKRWKKSYSQSLFWVRA